MTDDQWDMYALKGYAAQSGITVDRMNNGIKFRKGELVVMYYFKRGNIVLGGRDKDKAERNLGFPKKIDPPGGWRTLCESVLSRMDLLYVFEKNANKTARADASNSSVAKIDDSADTLCQSEEAHRKLFEAMGDSADTACQSEEAYRKKWYATFSDDQRAALDVVLADMTAGKGGTYFLTGPAGTGKTYMMGYLSEFTPSVMTATTGIAAQLLCGRTIHSLTGWSLHGRNVSENVFASRMKGYDLLVIDEASMLSKDFLDELMAARACAEMTFTMLLVGDFMQLPPVQDIPCFRSSEWKHVQRLELTVQHRQDDDEFVQVLSDVRRGAMTGRVRALLEDRRIDKVPDDVTLLAPRNDTVERKNLQRLSRLAGEESVFVSRTDPRDRDYPHKKARFVERLRLKVGARVVMLINDKDKQFVNGSTGYVTKLPDTGRNSIGAIKVKLDDGLEIEVPRHEETILNGHGHVSMRIWQYPMKLAWALTIHKSQGMTLDSAVVDMTGHFAPGQTYVALSRVRSKEGLRVYGQLDSLPLVDAECALQSGLQPVEIPKQDYSNIVF